MRWLVLLALVVPLLAACDWLPFSSASGPATPTHRGPAPPSMDGGPTPPRRGATVVTGASSLTDNSNDSYVAWGVALVSATERSVEIPLPSGYSTVTDLQVRVATAPGRGSSWTLTVDKNGSATALSCSISGRATTCNDASLVAIVAGDTIDLHVSPFGSPALTTITWLVKLLR